MKLGGNLPQGHDVLLYFCKWHGISYIASHTDTAGHTKAFIIPSHTDTAGHTKAFIIPSHTDTAGHIKVFIYRVTQTRLDIPGVILPRVPTMGSEGALPPANCALLFFIKVPKSILLNPLTEHT